MGYTVHIRHLPTNVERLMPWPDDTWEGESSEFIWVDGNYACDCNRGLFFARANNEPDPDRNCGMSEYAIWIEGDDGSVLYEEEGSRISPSML